MSRYRGTEVVETAEAMRERAIWQKDSGGKRVIQDAVAKSGKVSAGGGRPRAFGLGTGQGFRYQ